MGHPEPDVDEREGLFSIEASHWLDRVRNIRVDLLP